MPFSENAERLARHLVHTSSDGLRSPLPWSEFAEKFSAEPGEIAEAVYELERGDLLSVSKAMNTPQGISHIRPYYELFWAYDSEELGYDTAEDIVTLAQHLLSDDQPGHVPELHKKTGWPKRRFNPPLAYIMQEFPDGHVSHTLQNEYPTMQLIVNAEGRVLLKEIIHEFKQTHPEKTQSESENSQKTSAIDSHSGKQTARFSMFGVEFEGPLYVTIIIMVIVAIVALIFGLSP